MTYVVKPIGYVEKTDFEVRLMICDKYWSATTHLELFSHIIVLWWIDRMDAPETRRTLLVTPPRKKGSSPSGVFACRSPARPNPIGHTIVRIELLDEKNHFILVDHMDADNETPILDIKPYLPSSDRVEDARTAPWFEYLKSRYA